MKKGKRNVPDKTPDSHRAVEEPHRGIKRPATGATQVPGDRNTQNGRTDMNVHAHHFSGTAYAQSIEPNSRRSEVEREFPISVPRIARPGDATVSPGNGE
jgi:hypothetical protein